MSQLKASLRKYLQDNFLLGPSARPLADDASLMAHHVMDSTGFLELVCHLEEHYAIVVKEEEMLPENLDSIDRLATFIQSKLPTRT